MTKTSMISFLLRAVRRHWKIGLLLFFLYLGALWVSSMFLPNIAILFPASAIAVSVLFFAGARIWPVVYIASLISNFVLGSPLVYLLIMPFAQALQAGFGATILRRAGVDPLFRRTRDILITLAAAMISSVVVPTFGVFTRWLNTFVTGEPFGSLSWLYWYTGTVFCFVVIVPFILRWFAKPRFARSLPETLETLIVFGGLLSVCYAIFIADITAIGPFPLVYTLFIPLFWIALRLRPRFTTLALILVALAALSSLYITPDPQPLNDRIFQVETFMIVLSGIFLIISSLQEDRRIATRLIRSQMATLENAVSRISSESRAKNDFIAILAHELRNPLAPVVSAIELMKETRAKDHEDQETLIMMEERMQTVRHLLDDLLDISRISEGKLSLKKEPTELNAILRRAIVSTETYIEDRHQTVSIRAPKEALYVMGDPVRLEQVFTNLITNASKYSDPGDPIDITLRKDGDSAEITVKDTGIGIPPEMLDTIFLPFQQIEQGSRTRKGLGIGLALVHNFVTAHEGSISVLSDGAGLGSRFVVRLPLTEHAAGTADRTETSIKAAARDSGPSVLVVDDNDAAAWGIGKLLSLRGARVAYAYDAGQAIEQALNERPDIALLDLGLPDRDGYSVAETLRAQGYTGRLIALTGFSTDDVKARGKAAGFDGFLVKPAGLAELMEAIPEIA
ncbi:MAG TPA: ATP-binding protein [Candidatus Paceibacterota bacterium]